MKAQNDKLKEITAQLEQGVKDVFTSDKFINYLSVMSKFHDYSFNNTLLICLQKPDATLVAGYMAWQTKFKRHVRKGEKGIKILAPIPCKTKREVLLKDGTSEEEEVSFTRFRTVSVFDISQTDGEDLPESFITKLYDNVDGYEEMIRKLKDISPVPVAFEDIDGSANGYFHSLDKRIVVQKGMAESQTIKTLVHEIAHSILHDRDTGLEKEAGRKAKEVQAESVAYVVNKYLGLDTSEYSFGYIAAWSSGMDVKELRESLETIRNASHDIIEKISA